MPIHLIQQYYCAGTEARQKEIDECLVANLGNPFIAKVYLLLEEPHDFSSFPHGEKIEAAVIGRRLTFEEGFRHANWADPAGEATWILSNADIFFDHTVQHLASVELRQLIFALTRHDLQADGSSRLVSEEFAHGCQDAWVFKTPVPLEKMSTSFFLGVAGCDHRIAYEFFNAGYDVINPCLKISAVHRDLTREIRTSVRVGGYDSLCTDDNVAAGKVAPRPYLYYLFPTDRTDLSSDHSFFLYRQSLRHLLQLNESLVTLYQEVAGRDERITALEEWVHGLTAKADGLEQEVARREWLLAERVAQVADLERWLSDRENYFAGEIAEREKNLQGLVNSASWKVTAPLRWLHAKISKQIPAKGGN